MYYIENVWNVCFKFELNLVIIKIYSNYYEIYIFNIKVLKQIATLIIADYNNYYYFQSNKKNN